ncbi:MAG: TetR/AcrR family transcriptional regulator [Myxococcota bacterium]
MTRHTAHTARGEATRQRLLAAAREQILSGEGEMELAAVAARAGVSPGLPYRYFASKSALLVAVVENFFDALDDAVYRPVFEEVSSDWWEREKARIEKMVDFFYDQPLGRYVVSQLGGDASTVAAQKARLTRQARGASANVRTGQKLGRVPPHVDADLCGPLLMGGVYEALRTAHSGSRPVSKRRLVRSLQTFMRNVLEIEE